MNNELVLKPINELLQESFLIPAYQRGYRWTKRQVCELLDDVYEFYNQDGRSKKEFYCLQPVVVRKNGEQWELVDGQQRLTTIFLILSFFNSRFAEEFREPLYSIEYETRQGSKDYLATLDEAQKDDNIDFFHIYESYSQIKEWFKDKRNLISDIESIFLNSVKVIWYDVREDIDPVTVFTRLNIGKIPLTNAELVKALFLKGSNFETSSQYHNQLKISQEWDEIEQWLQNDEFWFFLNNYNKEANRIEFILNLVTSQLPVNSEIPSRDPFYIFLSFHNHLLQEDVFVEEEWLKVKQCFMTLREWFEHRVLFHLVGLLVHSGKQVDDLLTLHNQCKCKSQFKFKLVSQEFCLLFPKERSLEELLENEDEIKLFLSEELEELNYESSYLQIKRVLVLFNIASLLVSSSSNERFQFNRFKMESWDIEHIRSLSSQMPTSTDRQKVWLKNVLSYLSDSDSSLDVSAAETEISKLANELLANSSFDSEKFEGLYLEILNLYGQHQESEADHELGNLTLLDSSTNRSYQNAIFPIKRERIISHDKSATFVPLCTKNVFLKYYSKQLNNMLFWGENDNKDYFNAIVEILSTFFSNKEVLK